MTSVSASAPGKLVLAGEYAVLQGGPAIAIAAGRRVHAKVSTANAGELHIANTDERFAFHFDCKQFSWEQDAGEQGRLLEVACKKLLAAGLVPENPGPLFVELDSREFYGEDHTKMGLGSSAAVCVALTACLQQRLAGQHDLNAALAVHRAFQKGQGSGIDVCTSYQGGVVAMSDGSIWQVDLPADVQIIPVWTGVPASTTARLQQLANFSKTEPAEHAALLTALSAQSAAALSACDAGDTVGLLAALESFSCGLEDLDEAAGLGIWSAEHRKLAELAGDTGLVYKPSGAGGGDFGVAFAVTEQAADTFKKAAASEGYLCGDFDLGVAGLQLD